MNKKVATETDRKHKHKAADKPRSLIKSINNTSGDAPILGAREPFSNWRSLYKPQVVGKVKSGGTPPIPEAPSAFKTIDLSGGSNTYKAGKGITAYEKSFMTSFNPKWCKTNCKVAEMTDLGKKKVQTC